MLEILAGKALDDLVDTRPPRDQFGPESGRPYLAFELSGGDENIADWLTGLPCPVIGLGDGPLAPACDLVLTDEKPLAKITANISMAPIAAMVLVQHLRASEQLDLRDTLTAESFAYAALQKGPEFLGWLKGQSTETGSRTATETPLLVRMNGHEDLQLTLNDPKNHNAIGVKMRDGLCEALDLALADAAINGVEITAAGRTFSTGGDVGEFGEVNDPATAHWVRSLRLPAWRLARLNDKLQVHVHGAAIGAGAEIAAFANRVSATEDAWFQLPELKYGLIPGAGGTASLPPRIGRQRTAYMALSMARIDAQTALDWGLVDEIC